MPSSTSRYHQAGANMPTIASISPQNKRNIDVPIRQTRPQLVPWEAILFPCYLNPETITLFLFFTEFVRSFIIKHTRYFETWSFLKNWEIIIQRVLPLHSLMRSLAVFLQMKCGIGIKAKAHSKSGFALKRWTVYNNASSVSTGKMWNWKQCKRCERCCTV